MTQAFVWALIAASSLIVGGFLACWIMLSIVACLTAVGVWIVYAAKHSPHSLTIFAIFLALSLLSEGLIERFRGSRRPSQEVSV